MRWIAFLFILWAGWVGAEEIRLAAGFALQRLPAVLAPAGNWNRIALCLRQDGLWLATSDSLWHLGEKQSALPVAVPIDAFACSQAGTRVLASQGKFGPLVGKVFVPRLPLPSPQMRLAAGPADSLLLFATQAPARLFRFDGEHATLLATLAEPILAAAAAGEFVVVALPSGIYRLRPGEPLGLLLPWGDMPPIVSLVIHPSTAEIFFSTEEAIYLLDEGLVTQLAAGLGGALAVTGESVFVADAIRKAVFRLYPRKDR